MTTMNYQLPKTFSDSRLLQLVEWGYATGTPDIKVKNHSHNFWQANWGITGKALFSYNGQSVTLSRGEMLFLPPGLSHRLQYPGQFLGLSFKYYTDLHPLKEPLHLPATRVNKSIIQSAEWLVKAMFPRKGLNAIEGNKINEDDHYHHVLESLLSGVIRYLAEQGAPLPTPAKQLQSMIYNRQGQWLQVSEAAKILGISRNTLNQLVQASTGLTAREFMEQERTTIATHYLKFSGKRIGEIAEIMGFSSPSHFTTFFRRNTGKTPEEYLRNLP